MFGSVAEVIDISEEVLIEIMYIYEVPTIEDVNEAIGRVYVTIESLQQFIIKTIRTYEQLVLGGYS